jgi:hypothetical protein
LFGQNLERYTPVYIKVPTVDIACQSRNYTMKYKELSVDVRENCDEEDTVSGEGYKTISRVLKVSKSTGVFLIGKLKRILNYSA